MTEEEHGEDSPEKIDSLVWHYERERRLKMNGSISWDHEVLGDDPSHSFTIKASNQFVSNSVFLDVLVPSVAPVDVLSDIFKFVADNAHHYAKSSSLTDNLPISEKAFMRFDGFPDHEMTAEDCTFTGRIFFYTMIHIDGEVKVEISKYYRERGLYIVIRDGQWISHLQKHIDRSTVFLGHDSADKDDLVRELAHMINGKEIKVWYDEISLRPGDRLRKSLEAGLEDADYFMPIVTEHFLANEKYADYELEAILQKYITEKSPIIVPVCVGVSPNRLKEKSRLLADFVAIQHRDGDSIENLAHQIADAVDPQIPIIGKPLPKLELPGKEGLFSVGVSFGPKDGSQESDAT